MSKEEEIKALELEIYNIGQACRYSWAPQFNYWRRPEQMEDGGANLID